MNVHEITAIEGELGNLLRKTFANGGRDGYIKVDGCVLPERYKLFVDDIENFQIRDDDIWLCSFPKTGTTWTKEMIWSIVNDLDFERGTAPVSHRIPCIEGSTLITTAEAKQRETGMNLPNNPLNSVIYARDMPSPRLLHTHLPSNLLPRQLRTGDKKPKIIHVVRNDKDTCISYYHWLKIADGFEGSFEDFATLFLGDTITYGPFWKHVKGFWDQRHHHNMLFLKYEDMKKDLPSVIRRTAAFLDKNLTNDQVSLLTEHLSFSNMKKNPAVNYESFVSRLNKVLQVKREGTFMRSGTTEQWKTVMTPELIKRFDDWTNKHLDGTTLSL